MEAKYLRITICDNDFTTSLRTIGELLYETFYMEGKYPTEEQLPELKETIKYLWYGTHSTSSLIRLNKVITTNIDYFKPDLEFVDYLNIPDWENYECVYIPMFDNAEILVR